jgi:hypothetical protein
MLSSAVKVSPTLVNEFYVNIDDYQNGTFHTMLQGKDIIVTPTLICDLTHIPMVIYLPYSWTLEEALPHSEIIATLEIGKIEVDNYYSLKTLLIHVRLIYRVVAVSLHPVSSTNLILLDRVHFLYALLQNTTIDFATRPRHHEYVECPPGVVGLSLALRGIDHEDSWDGQCGHICWRRRSDFHGAFDHQGLHEQERGPLDSSGSKTGEELLEAAVEQPSDGSTAPQQPLSG